MFCQNLFAFSIILIIYLKIIATETSYSRNINVFERSILNSLASEEIPGDSDYLISTNAALDAYKRGEPVTPQQLGKFSEALNQYFSSRAYAHHYFNASRITVKDNYVDPICLPNSTAGSTIELYKVRVLGYPSFKKNVIITTEIDPSYNVKDFTLHFRGTSDVIIFNGFFRVDNEPFYFVYHTYDNIYSSDHNKIRTTNTIVKSKRVNDSLSIGNEVLIHTYDSTLPKYSEVNDSLYPTIQTVLKDVYLPKLAVFVDAQLKTDFVIETRKFSETYRNKLIDTIADAVKALLLLSNNDVFEFSPVNLTRELIRGKTMIHSYSASIKGFAMFERYELTNSSKSETDSLLELMDVVTVYYPPSGDKVAQLDIKATDQSGQSSKSTYVIKSIKLMASYKANVGTYPIHVYPNLEKWFFTKTGYFAQLEMYNFNEFYDFISYHLNREIGIILGKFLS